MVTPVCPLAHLCGVGYSGGKQLELEQLAVLASPFGGYQLLWNPTVLGIVPCGLRPSHIPLNSLAFPHLFGRAPLENYYPGPQKSLQPPLPSQYTYGIYVTVVSVAGDWEVSQKTSRCLGLEERSNSTRTLSEIIRGSQNTQACQEEVREQRSPPRTHHHPHGRRSGARAVQPLLTPTAVLGVGCYGNG